MTHPLPTTPSRTARTAAALLILYGGVGIVWAVGRPDVEIIAFGLMRSALALLLGLGLWRGVRWAWWGALVLVLLTVSWLAIGGLFMGATADGRSTLVGLALTPFALGSTITELAVLILLLVPSTRAAFRSPAAAHEADKR